MMDKVLAVVLHDARTSHAISEKAFADAQQTQYLAVEPI
jgi:hypothetical protein